jgi:hypothetical protein
VTRANTIPLILPSRVVIRSTFILQALLLYIGISILSFTVSYSTMASKSKSKQEDVLQFLDDLDSLSPSAQGTTNPSAPAPGTNEGEAEVLAFLDEITQKSTEPTRTTTSHRERPTSRSGTPTLRKSTDRVRVGTPSGSSLLPSSSSASSLIAKTATSEGDTAAARDQVANSGADGQGGAGAGWGWGSVWSSASAAIQQAKSAVDEQVKYLPKNEQARKWGEGVIEYAKTAQLDKLGTSAILGMILEDFINE